MSQWKANGALANNSPTWVAEVLNEGSGAAAIAANNTALFANNTGDAFITGTTVGSFGVTALKIANVTSEGPGRMAGWNLRSAGQGPVLSLTGSDGSGYANGETVLLHGGYVNATATITTNATGNLVSASIPDLYTGGRFTNSASVQKTFHRQKHINDLKVTGSTSGYNNSDYILVTNSVATTNGIANISTNSIGGFVNSGITVVNVGLFANVTGNTDVVFSILNANGTASVGTGATVTANLSTSTGGTLTAVMGGRAGRVHYECLVAMRDIDDTSEALP